MSADAVDAGRVDAGGRFPAAQFGDGHDLVRVPCLDTGRARAFAAYLTDREVQVTAVQGTAVVLPWAGTMSALWEIGQWAVQRGDADEQAVRETFDALIQSRVHPPRPVDDGEADGPRVVAVTVFTVLDRQDEPDVRIARRTAERAGADALRLGGLSGPSGRTVIVADGVEVTVAGVMEIGHAVATGRLRVMPAIDPEPDDPERDPEREDHAGHGGGVR
jgi:hypothetical protein